MVQYGIVSFSSYVWHLFLGEKLYLTGPKSRWCIFFWVFLGQKLPSKFCPKMTCFRSCCSMGILQPRIFFHANKYRKKKYCYGLDTPKSSPGFEGEIPIIFGYPSQILVFGLPHTFTKSISSEITWKLGLPIEKGRQVLHGLFHRVEFFVSLKTLGTIILYRELYSVVQRFEDTGIMKYRVLKTQMARPEQRMHFKSQGHFRCSARIEVISRFLEELISVYCLKPGINVRTGVSFCKGTLFHPLTSFDFWTM